MDSDLLAALATVARGLGTGAPVSPLPLEFREAVVTANGPLTIDLGGTVLAGVYKLQSGSTSITFNVNDKVLVLVLGSALYVLGKVLAG